jgi:phage/plasmid-associated DNA primase
MVSLAETEQRVVITHDDLNAYPWLLNCTNGTIELRSGDLSRMMKKIVG